MHAFTKILLGLACLLAVGLATLTVAYSANYHTVTGANSDLRTTLTALQTSNQTSNADQAQSMQEKLDVINNLSNQLGDIKENARQYESENAELRAQVAQLRSDVASANSRSNALIEGSKTASKIADGLREEVSRLWDEKLDLQRQGLELQDRINELESQYDVSTQTIRALQEQIAELKNQSTVGGPGEKRDPTTSPMPSRAIEARITEVGRDPGTGEMLLKIDVGRNDGVVDGMVFTVFRGTDQFLCKLKVERTDLQFSVGRADMLGRTGIDVRPNDRAMISPR